MRYLTTGLKVHHHGELLVGVGSSRGPDVDKKTVFVVLAAEALLHTRADLAILQQVRINECLMKLQVGLKMLTSSAL